MNMEENRMLERMERAVMPVNRVDVTLAWTCFRRLPFLIRTDRAHALYMAVRRAGRKK